MRGEIRLRSGLWEWRAVEVRDLPSGQRTSLDVYLTPAGGTGSRIQVKWSPDSEPQDATVAIAARHPSWRSLRMDNGEEWTFYPIPRPPLAMATPLEWSDPREVVFRSESGGHGRASLPQDLSLGDLTDEELAEIVECHGRR